MSVDNEQSIFEWAAIISKLMNYDWEIRMRLLYDLEHGNAKDWLEDFEKKGLPDVVIQAYKERFGIE